MAVFQATATGTTTIASGTYALLDSMTLTPGAGDYVLSFTSSVEGTNDTDIFFSVYVNGVAVAHTERVFRSEASIVDRSHTVAIYAYLPSVGAGQAVEIRWQRGISGTATCHERTLTLQEVDSADISQASATNDINTTSTTDTLMTNMTVTPGVAGDYIIYFSTSMHGNAGALNAFSIYIGGVEVAYSEGWR